MTLQLFLNGKDFQSLTDLVWSNISIGDEKYFDYERWSSVKAKYIQQEPRQAQLGKSVCDTNKSEQLL